MKVDNESSFAWLYIYNTSCTNKYIRHIIFASLDDYPVKYNNEPNEGGATDTDNKSNEEYVREKRFYPVPVNVGCIKGAQCCYDQHCRAFCSLCYGKNN